MQMGDNNYSVVGNQNTTLGCFTVQSARKIHNKNCAKHARMVRRSIISRKRGRPVEMDLNLERLKHKSARLLRRIIISDKRSNILSVVAPVENSTVSDVVVVADSTTHRIRCTSEVVAPVENSTISDVVVAADSTTQRTRCTAKEKGKAPMTQPENNFHVFGSPVHSGVLSSISHTLKFGDDYLMQSQKCSGYGISSSNQGSSRVISAVSVAIPKDKANDEGYLDFGDATYVCIHCNASMWYDERTSKKKHEKPPKFPSCCSNGKVKLPMLKSPPETLIKLLTLNDEKSKQFINNIRAYNMMFSFTSMGGKVDSSINRTKGPYVYKMHGANYHRIGSLLPLPGNEPKFSQLYIYDTENEINNRIRALSRHEKEKTRRLDNVIVGELRRMVDRFNPFAVQFRNARESIMSGREPSLRLNLVHGRNTDGRTHNLPTASEVAALIPGDLNVTTERRDVVLQTCNGKLLRISELHPSYVPLQYPLLFPYGEDGYRVDVVHGDADFTARKRVRLTMREFFAFRIHERQNESNTLFLSRRLFQQFLVDSYTMIESERLSYIKFNQVKLRSGKVSDMMTAVENGNIEPSTTGKRILPSSFTGGPKNMIQNFQDAMTICKYYSYPDLFITITCNPKWPEITRFLSTRGLETADRPDILCRMFKIKLDRIINDFKEFQIFGKIDALVYTVEFQKRGLPHAHILLFLNRENKIPNPEDVDRIISAEIPDENDDPMLHNLVRDYMMHGPCGLANRNSPCMNGKYCSKHFPKKYTISTSVDHDGYPLYRRRNDGRTVSKKGVELDNGFVVPYSPVLLRRYQGHINVEWCNQHKSIKYLFKYINKGPDRVTVTVDEDGKTDVDSKSKDEVENYINCRYISPCEAVWRTLQFDIHHRFPPVMRLNFHLPNEQSVVFDDDVCIDDVLQRPNAHRSKFLAWMERNRVDKKAKKLTYAEFPSKYVWDAKRCTWERRRDSRFSLGRLYNVPPTAGEEFYLGILLPHSRGSESYEEIRTIGKVVYPTFKDACYSLGLLDDDREYVDGIVEASFWASAYYVRNLFSILLLSSSMNSPEKVFEKTLDCLSDDIQSRQRRLLNLPDLILSNEELKNYTLIEIEKLLQLNGSTLSRFSSMPLPDQQIVLHGGNKLIREELSYDRTLLGDEYASLRLMLTPEQKVVFEEILKAVLSSKGGIFFLYGYGGTGKTFIWKTLSAAIRSEGHIVLNVASSGIAALLLPGGRTAHSRFKIPINIDESSTCNITPGSELSELVIRAKLIIWDEAPMINRFSFEALDRTLRDIVRNSDGSVSDSPFGGKTVVLGGDFRQILPVIPNGSRDDVIHSTINSSYLFEHCKVLKLTRNMRLESGNSSSDSCNNEVVEFSDWIVKVGDGKLGDSRSGFAEIEIPSENLIFDDVDPVMTIVRSIYPFVELSLRTDKYFEDRVILAPTHRDVDSINEKILSIIPGDQRVYLSYDSICKLEFREGGQGELVSVEFLNSLKCSGMPSHHLVLKKGVPIVLLRNIDMKSGLCNGTRLIVSRLGDHIIEAEIISGRNIGNRVFIPRMTMSNSDITMPVNFTRRQFPISICFAMTINKSQGQSLSTVGLYLPKPVFTHGQLYVALSRVKSRSGLKILCLDSEGKPCNYTTNVVYREVFRNL